MTPSAERAASCLAAPFVPLKKSSQSSSSMDEAESVAYRTLMTPFELMTRCHGTVVLLCLALGWSLMSGRYLRQTPT